MTGKLMDCVQCAGCKLHFHLNCTKTEYQKAIKLGKNNTYEFTCSMKCAKLSKQMINIHFPFMVLVIKCLKTSTYRIITPVRNAVRNA